MLIRPNPDKIPVHEPTSSASGPVASENQPPSTAILASGERLADDALSQLMSSGFASATPLPVTSPTHISAVRIRHGPMDVVLKHLPSFEKKSIRKAFREVCRSLCGQQLCLTKPPQRVGQRAQQWVQLDAHENLIPCLGGLAWGDELYLAYPFEELHPLQQYIELNGDEVLGPMVCTIEQLLFSLLTALNSCWACCLVSPICTDTTSFTETFVRLTSTC